MRFSPYLGTGNDIRYRTPAILGINTFLLTLVLGIPLMMYGHIRWYWGFLLLPVLGGILMALATSTKTIRIIYMVISAMGVGTAVGFLAMFVDVGFGACMGLLVAVIWGVAINLAKVKGRNQL